MSSILWRRLDRPGHDACRLERAGAGWRLAGTAVFQERGAPALLAYSLVCDASWRSETGRVEGWIGDRAVRIAVERSSHGTWTLAGAAVYGLEGCVDLDLAVTPATNLCQIRRIALAPGRAAEVPVAWLDVAAGTLELLPQRYERRSDSICAYEAPTVGYAGLLELRPDGFVRRYPGLWEEVP
jgi:hypothetical protein